MPASQSYGSPLQRLGGPANRRPQTLQEVEQWGLVHSQTDMFLREFLDAFYLQADRSLRQGMFDDEPVLRAGADPQIPTHEQDLRTDAYLAAVAEHLAFRHRLVPPAWSRQPQRFLRRPYFPCGLESLKAILIVESPVAFRRRMIFVGFDPLCRPRRDTPGFGEPALSEHWQKAPAGQAESTTVSRLHKLDRIAKRDGVVWDLSVYGGLLLPMAFRLPCSTRDVDTVVRADHKALLGAAAELAAQEGWPADWIYDVLRCLPSKSERLALMEAFDPVEAGGLRVHMPSPEYVFAMRCMSMRLSNLEGSNEASGIRALAEVVGMFNPASALDLIEGFYPGGRIPPEAGAVVRSVLE